MLTKSFPQGEDMRYVSSVSGNCRDVIADQTLSGYMVKR